MAPTATLPTETLGAAIPDDVPTPLATATPTDMPEVEPIATATPTSTVLPATGANAEAAAEYGLQVYKQQFCGLCHQLDAVGTAGTFGPPHDGMATIAALRIQEPQYTGKAATAAEYIYESIVDPKAFMVPGYEHTQHQMPIYTFLSEPDVEALVQMLLQQK